MLQKIFTVSLSVLLFASSCVESNPPKQLPVSTPFAGLDDRLDWTPPPTGEVVDKWEKPIANTRLHNAYFRASVITTDSSDKGHYIIKSEYGASVHEVPYKLPEWNDDRVLKPWIQKVDSLPFGCAIGFNSGDDVFRPFYVLKVINGVGDMDIKQVATYTLSR